MIMLGVDIGIAVQRLEQLCREVKETHRRYQDKLLPPVTLSVGIAQAPEHGIKADELLRAADHALYSAKLGGRDRIEVFKPA